MKIKFSITIVSVLLLIMMAACAVTDVDRKVDFNRYKTFGWAKSEIKTDNPVYNSDLINKNIRNTITQEFAKRGITEDKTNPDFLVKYYTYTEKKESASSGAPYFSGYPYFAPWGFFPYGYSWRMPYGYLPPRTHSFTEGTLIVDIMDAKTQEVFWRGTVSGNVDNLKKLQRQVQKGVQAVMKKYPVPATDELVLPDKNDIS